MQSKSQFLKKVKYVPIIHEDEVKIILDNMKLNKSERINDVPAKVFRRFSNILAKPITKLINLCIQEGIWPECR